MTHDTREVVILSGVRTAIGDYGGSLKDIAPSDLAARVVKEAVARAKIDPASVKVEYLRGSGVDLTARLKASIKPEGIEVASAQAPAGEHAFRVSVRDTEGREGKTEFKLTVK